MSRDSSHIPRSAGQTEIGLVRSSNQDAIVLDEPEGLWLVADGMGGHSGGGQASRLATRIIQSAIRDGLGLRESILHAHHAIRDQQLQSPELAEMGTTVVAMREHEDTFQVAWVGDSRAYLFDRRSGQLAQLTRDHNLAGLMVQTGALSRAEAARHPRRHVLTDCLGLHGAQEPRIDRVEARWQNDQLVLLCSDGLNGELSDQQIADVLADETPLEQKVSRLIQMVKAAGARDNVSAILVRSPLGTVASAEQVQGWRRWLRRDSH